MIVRGLPASESACENKGRVAINDGSVTPRAPGRGAGGMKRHSWPRNRQFSIGEGGGRNVGKRWSNCGKAVVNYRVGRWAPLLLGQTSFERPGRASVEDDGVVLSVDGDVW